MAIWHFLVCIILFSGFKSGFANGTEYLIQTKNTLSDLNFMPTLANGHLGFTVFGESIFVNGVYNGHAGSSRRARIPNFLNISVASLSNGNRELLKDENKSLYSMNLLDGFFYSEEYYANSTFKLTQRYYAHRYYDRALVYELFAEQLSNNPTSASLKVHLKHLPGGASDAFKFTRYKRNVPDNVLVWRAVTKQVENAAFQKSNTTIYIAMLNGRAAKEINHSIENQDKDAVLHYKFIVAIDESLDVALKELEDVSELSNNELIDTHRTQWRNFWQQFNFSIDGNLELSQTINAGVFYIANALPSMQTNQPRSIYYGLSPTGLGRGESEADYEGHNFWDTEIWMLPAVMQLSPEWGKELLDYRFRHLNAARFNANITGFKGARFPWESAYTGTEVTQACCPEVAAQEIHISADIVFAMEKYYTQTNSTKWLCETALPVVTEVADFFVSRVEWNDNEAAYILNGVMGPDEDHENVSNNVFTNQITSLALKFASFAHNECSKSNSAPKTWLDIAEKLLILYDNEDDYHPQYSGFTPNETVKQADTILLGYPLQTLMNDSTRINDLNTYERITRASGPAMTWSMFSINYLDVNQLEKANHYFLKGYKDYIHSEYKVWSETKLEYEGSANFLTGIGGVLQALINGYGGMRLHRTNSGNRGIMEIRKTSVPPQCKSMTINGLKFQNATFQLHVSAAAMSYIKVIQMPKTISFKLQKGASIVQLFEGYQLYLNDESIQIFAA